MSAHHKLCVVEMCVYMCECYVYLRGDIFDCNIRTEVVTNESTVEAVIDEDGGDGGVEVFVAFLPVPKEEKSP